MKIFVIPGNYADNYNPWCNNKTRNALSVKDNLYVYTKAESTLLKGHKPFFVPDELGEIDLEAHVAVRISRLGKSIPTRFASRYYDALTLGVVFTPHDWLARSINGGMPYDLALNIDNSAAIGDWVSIDKFCRPGALDFKLDINGETVQKGNTAWMIHSVDKAINCISQYTTIKMGDIIYTGCPMNPVSATPDTRLTGWIEDKKVLEMDCK